MVLLFPTPSWWMLSYASDRICAPFPFVSAFFSFSQIHTLFEVGLLLFLGSFEANAGYPTLGQSIKQGQLQIRIRSSAVQ